MNKVVKIILIVVVIGALGYGGYVFFGSKKPLDMSFVKTNIAGGDTSTVTAMSDDQSLNILLNINSITLSNALLEKPAFKMLQDFNVVMPTALPFGRDNPFLPPDPNEVSTTTTTTQTAPPATTVQQVITVAPNPLTATSATLLASFSGTATERYFEWSAQDTGTFSNKVAIISDTLGGFSGTLLALSPNTTYYFRAVVKNGTLVSNGTTISFRTLAK